MTIRKVKGKWQARFWYVDSRGEKKQKQITAESKSKVKEEVQKFYEKQDKRREAKKLHKFRRVADDFLKLKESRVKESSIVTLRSRAQHVVPYFRGRSIERIEIMDIVQWKAEMKAKGFKPAYLASLFALLEQIFDYGIDCGYIAKNPAKSAGGFKDYSMQEEKTYFDIRTFNRFISAVDDNNYRVFFMVLFYTGMRSGEALALKVSDIKGSKIKINKTITTKTADGSRWKITTPKTKKSIREVEMPKALEEELSTYTKGKQSDRRVFESIPIGHLYRTMKKYCEKADVPIIRVHDLRHSHASLLIQLGAPITLVSEHLGHADIKTTLEVYSHLLPHGEHDIIEKLNKSIEQERDKEGSQNVHKKEEGKKKKPEQKDEKESDKLRKA